MKGEYNYDRRTKRNYRDYAGFGYRKIAIKLELSRDEVRNYCKVRHLCREITEQKILLKDDESVCIHCGTPFKSSSKSQKYCSHKCYVQDRFYRDEQMEYLISQLKKGEVVENAPQWIKDLIGVK